MTFDIRAFTPTIDQERMARLAHRLDDLQWPRVPATDGWAAGIPESLLRDLLDQWRDLELTTVATRLGQLSHFTHGEGGQQVHFLHHRSPHPEAVPVLLTHGWPSSFLEYVPIIEALTHPERHGGSPADAFHVVIPSLPGYMYSGSPQDPASLRAAAVADRLDCLMADLGHRRYLASGTDIGARVTAWLLQRHRQNLLGAHMSVNVLTPVRSGTSDRDAAAAEAHWIEQMEHWEESEGGYHHLLRTRPMAAAVAFSDSPAGMAAWVLEKWHTWADDLDLGAAGVREHLLTLLTLYWTTGSFAPALYHYYAYGMAPGPRPAPGNHEVPVSLYASGAGIGGVPPRSVAQAQYGDHRWTVFPRGGHFMSVEQPDLFVANLRDFRRQARS